jgi:hypothetical protein
MTVIDTTQFYILAGNPNADLRRCEHSRRTRHRITVVGSTEEGGIAAFTGVVRTVKHDPNASRDRQWRVTISN